MNITSAVATSIQEMSAYLWALVSADFAAASASTFASVTSFTVAGVFAGSGSAGFGASCANADIEKANRTRAGSKARTARNTGISWLGKGQSEERERSIATTMP